MDPITSDAVDLGLVVKKFTNNHNMDDFEYRLRLQKEIYLLQAFDVYMGYYFRYYIRGPYCAKLANAGFELVDIFDEIKDYDGSTFRDTNVEKNFKKAREFIDRLQTIDDLEIAASLHLWFKTTGLSRDEVIEKVLTKSTIPGKKDVFTRRNCLRIWEELLNQNLVEDVPKS